MTCFLITHEYFMFPEVSVYPHIDSRHCKLRYSISLGMEPLMLYYPMIAEYRDRASKKT